MIAYVVGNLRNFKFNHVDTNVLIAVWVTFTVTVSIIVIASVLNVNSKNQKR